MLDTPSTSVPLNTPLFSYLQNRGIDIHKIFKNAGLPADMINHKQKRIPISSMNWIIKRAYALTGQDDLGIRITENIHIGMAGVVGYLMMNCHSSREALVQYCKYQSLPGDIVQIRIDEDGDDLKIRWRCNEQAAFPRYHFETVTTMLVILGRELTGKDIQIKTAMFSYPAPSYAEKYNELFKTKVIFDAPETSFIFASNAFDIPLRQPNNDLFTVLDDRAQDELRTMTRTQCFASQVKTVMNRMEPAIPQISHLAKELKMNIRSLQLKLKEEGYTYRTLKDELLKTRAIEFLKKGYSITEISRCLGFSEPRAFNRSFRRWTGTTPGDYRRMLGS